MWSLVRQKTTEFTEGQDDFPEFILDSSEWKNYTLGRIGDIRTPSVFVSRYHCEIEYRHDLWWIRDTNSSNGTFVNDERIDHWTQLNHGDRITLGDDEDYDEEAEDENSIIVREEKFVLKIVNSVKAEFDGMPILEPMVSISSDPVLLPKITVPRGNKKSKRITKKRNKSRVCDICNKSFDRKSTFDYHLNFHSDLRPYICCQCNPTTSFRSIYHLRSHEKKRHPLNELTALPLRAMNTENISGEVTYTRANNRPSNSAKRRKLEVEPMPNVQNRGPDFLNSSVKKIVELPSNIVENTKLYRCAHCKGNKVFTDKNRYKLHLAVHKASKTFICKFCAFRSLKVSDLDAHISVNHPIVNTTNQNHTVNSGSLSPDSPIQVIYDSRFPLQSMDL